MNAKLGKLNMIFVTSMNLCIPVGTTMVRFQKLWG